MKKAKIIAAGVILLSVGTIATQKFYTPKNQNCDLPAKNPVPEAVQPAQASDPKISETPPAPKQQGYKIQEYNGNIAVFEKGQQKPFRQTEIAVKNLPETDRKELKNRIEAATSEELQALLEDYLS